MLNQTIDSNVVFRALGVTKVYDMGEIKVHALRGVDMELYSGELIVLLGPSGSGKSTLLNILGGLDTATGIIVLEVLDRINKELGIATVLITHNADIADMADRVIYLSDGLISRVRRNEHKKSPRELHW